MKLRVIILTLSLLVVMSTSVGGYLYYISVRKAAVRKIETEVVWHTEAARDRLSQRITADKRAIEGLARHRELQQLLVDHNSGALPAAHRILDSFNDSFEADVVYVMDRAGRTVASTNRDEPDSFMGKDYSFRPYFQQAMRGEPSVYLALGVTSGKRGIYFSHPVYLAADEDPLGVAVMKVSVELLEKEILSDRLNQPGMITMITDPHGVIFMSDQPAYLLLLLEQGDDRKLQAIAATRQFGEEPPQWSGFKRIGRDRFVDARANEYVAAQVAISSLPGWKVVHLHHLDTLLDNVHGPISETLAPLIGALCLLVGGAVLVLYRAAQKDIVKRRQAEEALRESENRFRLITQNARDMIYRMSLPDGTYEFVSDSAVDLCGYAPDEFYTKPLLIRQIIHPDWHDYFQTQWRALLAGDMPPFYEYQIVHRSGETRWHHQRNVLILDENGSPAAIEGIVTDISEMKETERELQRNRDLLAAIVESTDDGILVVDEQGTVIFHNERFQQLWRIPQELVDCGDDRQLLDHVLSQLADPETFLSRVQELYHTDEVDYDTISFTDGRIFERVSPPLIHNGAIIGRVWSFRDVTTRVRLEREREALIAKLQKALDEVKVLRGILPICSYCKKIRNDQGYWSQIEAYIREHSDAEFSHGICQECATKHFPDMDLYRE